MYTRYQDTWLPVEQGFRVISLTDHPCVTNSSPHETYLSGAYQHIFAFKAWNLAYSSILAMHSTQKKEKHHVNSRIRRYLDAKKKNNKGKGDKERYKDTDCESIISTLSATPVAAQSASTGGRRPLRLLLSNMIEAEDERQKGCPLRRVQFWHTIPLCLLAVIDLLLIIDALSGLDGYKIVIGVQRVVVEMMRSDLEVEPCAERKNEMDTSGGIFLEYQDKMDSEME